jgi:hypothetical protein
LSVAPIAVTTEVEEDIDGARPPWEVLPVAPATATTEVEEYVDGGPLRGACSCPPSRYVVVSATKMLVVTNDPVECWH